MMFFAVVYDIGWDEKFWRLLSDQEVSNVVAYSLVTLNMSHDQYVADFERRTRMYNESPEYRNRQDKFRSVPFDDLGAALNAHGIDLVFVPDDAAVDLTQLNAPNAPTWYYELAGKQAQSITQLEAERDAAIARAEAAVKERDLLIEHRDAANATMNEALSQRDELMKKFTAISNAYAGLHKRLAERDASAKRWVRLGCVLALLLPLSARAADVPSAPVEEPSVVLTAQQYQLILNTLADRDPVVHMLLLAQRQQAEARAAAAKPPEPPK